jgi:hypothetical protein
MYIGVAATGVDGCQDGGYIYEDIGTEDGASRFFYATTATRKWSIQMERKGIARNVGVLEYHSVLVPTPCFGAEIFESVNGPGKYGDSKEEIPMFSQHYVDKADGEDREIARAC